MLDSDAGSDYLFSDSALASLPEGLELLAVEGLAASLDASGIEWDNDDELIEILARAAEGMSPEEVENFQNFLRQAGQVAAQILPVAGQVVGGIYGGPAGAALGGAAGSMGAQLLNRASGGSPSRATAQPRPAAAPPRPAATQPAPAATQPAPAQPTPTAAQPAAAPPTPAAAQPGPASPSPARTLPGPNGQGSATAMLAALLSNPAVSQALTALMSGRTETIPAGPENIPVPPAAVLNAMSVLIDLALEEAPVTEDDAAAGAYLRDAEGTWKAAPDNPESRAAVLLDVVFAPSPERNIHPRIAGDNVLDWLEDMGAFDTNPFDYMDD